MTESWYDWTGVLAIVLILVVCPTKLQQTTQIHMIQKDKKKLMEIVFHQKYNFWYYFIAKSSTY